MLTVDDIVPLPGPGLVTGTATLDAKHDALAAFTKATLEAMDQIAADPQKGLDATFAAVPDLAADPDAPAPDPRRHDRDLDEPAHRGRRTARSTRPAGRSRSTFMTALGLVPNPVTVDKLVDESLLP